MEIKKESIAMEINFQQQDGVVQETQPIILYNSEGNSMIMATRAPVS
jgi:hypothetical protein